MKPSTVLALNAINHTFYREHAASFSGRREHAWRGWQRVVAGLDESPHVSVLDLGCGNGRFALYLDERLRSHDAGHRTLRYVGIDASSELIAIAGSKLGHLASALVVHDVVASPEEQILPPASRDGHDLVALFGLLHHVPSAKRRLTLLTACLERLRPGGMLALTCWQFAARERFRDRLVPWQTMTNDIELDDLEPGDYLLRWGTADALRYCHFISPEEERAWTNLPGARLLETYRADGDTNDLNHYVLLERTE